MNGRRRHDAVLQSFNTRLNEEWKRKVVCACWSDQCHASRYVICVPAMEAWMKQVAAGSTSNLQLVLNALGNNAKHRTFGINANTILEGEKRCVRVLGILLQLGFGQLIDVFQSANVFDTYIMFNSPSDAHQLARLRDELRLSGIQDAGRIVDSFERAKWAFCSPRLELNMEHNVGGQILLPFCRRERINKKGGTANLFQVAVQKDFVTDEKLAEALRKSLYTDPEFGECYELAVKSFCDQSYAIYETERDAFRGLQVESLPIVRYLGSYSCNSGKCIKPDHSKEGQEGAATIHGKKFNLLLEFGQVDLDEYWAGEDTVAPVQAEEIIRYYESLFKVAKGLKEIHSLKVGRGEDMEVFYGWHADIKPDNILRVHGEFKLADFGFARFSRMTDGNNEVPERLIDGGTDAFSAPEAARALATRSPVRQTIDTWSFGCVLSVAATWVVLGFQGIIQYSRLRSIAVEKSNQSQEATDRFHDGEDVLPEIRHWHDYLKQHVRLHDVVTPKVIGIIEKSMLKKCPEDRLKSEELCVELDAIINEARDLYTGQVCNGRAKQPHLCVVRALSRVEEEAAQVPLSRPFTQVTSPNESKYEIDPGMKNRLKLAPSMTVDKRKGKADILARFPIAKTSFRQEILVHQNSERVVPMVNTQVGNTTPGTPKVIQEGEMRENPGEMNNADIQFDSLETPDSYSESPYVSPGASSTRSTNSSQFLDSDYVRGYAFTNSPSDFRQRSLRNKPGLSTSARSQPSVTQKGKYNSYQQVNVPAKRRSTMPPSDDVRSYDIGPEHGVGTFVANRPVLLTTKSNPDEPSRAFSKGKGKQIKDRELAEDARPVRGSVTNVSDEKEATEANLITSTGIHTDDMLNLETMLQQPTRNVEPAHVFELRYDICRVRKNIEANRPQSGLKKLQARLGKEKADKTLKGFISNRDIIFVVDNSRSMKEYWPIVIFVVETLQERLKGLDEDGIDVRFTLGDSQHRIDGLKGHGGSKKLRRTLLAAEPRGDTETDMNDILQTLFHECEQKDFEKKTTLIVFTDGLWKATRPPNLVEDGIVDFTRVLMQSGLDDRHFTIEFVRFGLEGRQKLKVLDDDIAHKHGIRDIVDQTSWKYNVDKMILGSLDNVHDDKDDPEELLEAPNMPGSFNSSFGPEKLVVLFKNFIESEKLLPSIRHSRSISAGSSHSLQRNVSKTPETPTMNGKKRFSFFKDLGTPT